MTPEYITQLADKADPDELWRLPMLEQKSLRPEMRQQLDTGVALRRYAHHLQYLLSAQAVGKSVLVSSIGAGGLATMLVDMPQKHARQVRLVEKNLKEQT